MFGFDQEFNFILIVDFLDLRCTFLKCILNLVVFLLLRFVSDKLFFIILLTNWVMRSLKITNLIDALLNVEIDVCVCVLGWIFKFFVPYFWFLFRIDIDFIY